MVVKYAAHEDQTCRATAVKYAARVDRICRAWLITNMPRMVLSKYAGHGGSNLPRMEKCAARSADETLAGQSIVVPTRTHGRTDMQRPPSPGRNTVWFVFTGADRPLGELAVCHRMRAGVLRTLAGLSACDCTA